MLVKLPRTATGQEIIDAFKTASTSQETPTRKWEAAEFVAKSHYEPGSVKEVIKEKSVRVDFFAFRGLLRKKWVSDLEHSFVLKPVALLKNYTEVEVNAVSVWCNMGGFGETIINPHSLMFEQRIRPRLEKILGNFYSLLQPQTTQTA